MNLEDSPALDSQQLEELRLKQLQEEQEAKL
jgi:hypothetical protein